MVEKVTKPLPSQGRGNINRAPTPEELKQHAVDHPKNIAAIRANHAKTVHKVRRMQDRIMWNDRG